MRTQTWVPILVLLAGLACAEDQAPPIAPEAEVPGNIAAADVSPTTAEGWVDDIRFLKASVIAPEPAVLSMSVADAPPGTAVKVIWYGPKGRMNDEMKNTSQGAARVEFSTGETSAWGIGGGRAEVWVGDEKVAEPEFEIAGR